MNEPTNDERGHPLPATPGGEQPVVNNGPETSTEERVAGCPDAPCSGYVRHYKASHHKEEATTSLVWKDGVLMQKWKISETRDIYGDEAKTDYSHTENHLEIEWRAIPGIPNVQVSAPPLAGATVEAGVEL